jgi:hypothetical protein
MYGLVNRALAEMVAAGHGAAVWQEIKAASGIDVGEFHAMTQYPDDVTVALVGAASQRLGVAPSAMLHDLGAYWIKYTAAEGYGDLLKLAGGSFASFLQNLDAMHARVGLSFPELRPPSFRVTGETEDSLTFHYYSERPGLTDLVVGLIGGLGDLFEIDVTIVPTALKSEGADHDVFHVTYAAR